MEKHGFIENGRFIVTLTYLDSPREDCNGYYESEIYFYNRASAIRYFYERREQDREEPVWHNVNFDIPLSIRAKHNDCIYVIKQNGKVLERCNTLQEAKKWRDFENKCNLHFRKSGKKEPIFQPCKIYIE